jgi:hypothetical protein
LLRGGCDILRPGPAFLVRLVAPAELFFVPEVFLLAEAFLVAEVFSVL